MNTFYQLTTLIIAVVAIISPIWTTYLQNRNKLRASLLESEIATLTQRIKDKQLAIKELSSAYGTMVSGALTHDKDSTALFRTLIQCAQYLDKESRDQILSFNGNDSASQQIVLNNISNIMDKMIMSIQDDQKKLDNFIDKRMPKTLISKKMHNKQGRK
ncbi:hypothetical protein DKZ23_09230 [Limosilactobacillus reuteri]|uniref:Uncharacterized protein n=1 Tax=Limosilactobacillus reuteri TaxID=1598 RepID=A0A317GFL5_LIMRT|nr:hypothetical protein [Limosilactobacillus reuteri]MCH5384660.1 hypothetical protein [Limosilactobacillus reuteri]PWT45673.1 hypothetical protein DKZ23_09230 [Limosilactobacillus reuteri]PWT48431.1 hypothetical protein DKZ33_09345 [Limosilactobacillus reuteri]PWT61551.1 hypothetical protein DKZ32_07760 [Limosilactobacillus reuteri]